MLAGNTLVYNFSTSFFSLRSKQRDHIFSLRLEHPEDKGCVSTLSLSSAIAGTRTWLGNLLSRMNTHCH